MAFLKGLFSFKKKNNFPTFLFVCIKTIHLAKSLTFQETDVGPARKMWQGVYYYLSYAVLFQFLPMGRPVIQRYYSRNAPFPKPKQSSLIRDDKLQGHRSSSGSPDHHWVKINIDWAFDIRVREWKIRSTVHNKAASILLPDDFPQTPAVYARDLHFDLFTCFYCLKNSTDYSWIRAREVPAPCLHFLQGDSCRSVLCEWNLRSNTSRTIYGHRRGAMARKHAHSSDSTVWLLPRPL